MTSNLALEIQSAFMVEYSIPLTINEVEKFRKVEQLNEAYESNMYFYVASYGDFLLIAYAEDEHLIDVSKIVVKEV